MILSINEILVDAKLYQYACNGDETAKHALRSLLDGIDLYEHNIIKKDNEIVVSIENLYNIGIIRFVKLESIKLG